MNTLELTRIKSVKTPSFWLLAIAAGLVAINLTLFWKMGNVAHAGMSALFWLAIASMLWDKRHDLQLESNLPATLLGALLIIWVLSISSSIPATKEDPLLSIAPFFFGIGVSLIASGFDGLKQFKNELIILFFLGIPRVLIELFFDISPVTAKVSSFILHYLGFEVFLREGIYIHLPQGSVKVFYGCSGMESITYTLGLSVVCLIMFPIKKSDRFCVPIVAGITGFLVNACRVALLAVLSNEGQKESFIYWHEGEGSLIFGMIAVAIFGLFYWFLLSRVDAPDRSKQEEQISFF